MNRLTKGISLHPLWVAVLVTSAVAVLGHVLPESFAGTAIGFGFLLATYLLVLRDAAPGVEREWGLSLGGLLELEAISWARVARAGARAVAWASGAALVTFPAFWAGYVYWYGPHHDFKFAVAASEVFDQLAAHLAVVALPEEAFYRGYVQTALDKRWPPRLKIFGARVGAGLLVASAIFAIGHVMTEPYLGRLAVFFPALVFGWLRARTGGIGASVVFHAACNGFAWYLGRGYGLFGDT